MQYATDNSTRDEIQPALSDFEHTLVDIEVDNEAPK